ncbi:hypothetical protein KQH61_00630 [bacterium]|nr:hypothetical protein [bacterium]
MKVMKVFIWGFVMILLTACSSTIAVPTFTNTAPSTVTATPLPPTATPTLPPTLAPTFTSTPIPPEVAGLRMAYIIEGNLYLQDGSNPPIQLTDDERPDQNPVFANDGEKIVFLRGLIPHDLYSINPDGSQEQVLVSGSILSQLGLRYDELSEIKHFEFIPGTHQLVFITGQLKEEDLDLPYRENLWTEPNNDLLFVDADTAEIKQVLAHDQRAGFEIAPTGNMIAIAWEGHINIVDLEGQVINRDLITYPETGPYVPAPYIFWNEDATELIVTMTLVTEYTYEGPDPRTVWRIPLDGSPKTQITFDPPILSRSYTISTDGYWILYDYYSPYEPNDSITEGLYLGNLFNGDSQLIEEYVTWSMWSPDNIHFLYTTNEWFLGKIDEQTKPIAIQGLPLGWLDTNHFLLFDNYDAEMVMILGVDGTIMNISVPPSLFIYPDTFDFVYTKSKP